MKDWKKLAQTSGLDIPADEIDRVIGPLQSLEETFRPLVKDLPPELEPATGMHFEEDSE